MALPTKDLIDLEYLTPEEITEILDTAKPMKDVLNRKIKTVPALRGKTVATLFYENSTRTRLSFELAAKYLSAGTCNISASASSVAKGESLQDTGKTLDAMGTDIIILRHNMSGAPKLLGEGVKARVINAGDGTHAHPTQALLDMFTIRERKGEIKGQTVTILGDILHSRVARSNIWGLTKLGAHVRVC
ncbi:MAG: aspartate carbamoyltransferase, partial [Clostridiales bacterium]